MIHFHIDPETINALTWEEFEAFEMAQEGQVKLSKLRPLLARFMVGEDGKVIPHTIAMKQLASVPLAKVKEVVGEFTNSLTGAAVPKASASLSSSPSEVNMPTSESPAGSQT